MESGEGEEGAALAVRADVAVTVGDTPLNGAVVQRAGGVNLGHQRGGTSLKGGPLCGRNSS